MFLPTTKDELITLKWEKLDIILISGDTYIDSPYNGTAVIGRWLEKHGFKVGIIAQPDINTPCDITRLGEPRLFWGISSGCVDSMVANYTALKRRRTSDDFTPGGINNKRPDRAVIAYTNLIKRYFKNSSVPIVLGGIEASLRRVAHYDFWSNSIRRSILFDSKADILSYGMGELSMLALANKLNNGEDWKDVSGISYISKEKKNGFLEIPSFDECFSDKQKFVESFNLFYNNCDPITAKGLIQKHHDRFLIQNPPSKNLSTSLLDEIYNLKFLREVHPYYKKDGVVKALDTIKFSITSHRGCYGQCNFCAIAVHQGRTVVSRSETSILKDVNNFLQDNRFRGNISDIGGPTGNMWNIACEKSFTHGSCKEKRCLFPKTCNQLPLDHSRQIKLLKKVKSIKGIKKVFLASGIRYDLILDDKKSGMLYLEEIIKDHISGQMKIAPEHTQNGVLSLMGKKGQEYLTSFKNKFYEINKKYNKNQYLTYYLMAAHPGCNEKEMMELKRFASKELRLNPEQIQVFTPTPSTYSSLMYYTEINPFTKKKIFVEKDLNRKKKQKDIVIANKKK